MSPVTIRRATAQDEQTVTHLWVRAAELLRELGTDQWQYPVRTENIRQAIATGTCWIVENDGGDPIGTVTLDDVADPRLWTPADQPDQAYYVHRLVLAPHVRGDELGSAILDWAGGRAKGDGKRWLRLDAWSANPGLHRYYLNRGFQFIRQVEAPGVVSGVLFQRDASISLGKGPEIKESRAS